MQRGELAFVEALELLPNPSLHEESSKSLLGLAALPVLSIGFLRGWEHNLYYWSWYANNGAEISICVYHKRLGIELIFYCLKKLPCLVFFWIDIDTLVFKRAYLDLSYPIGIIGMKNRTLRMWALPHPTIILTSHPRSYYFDAIGIVGKYSVLLLHLVLIMLTLPRSPYLV